LDVNGLCGELHDIGPEKRASQIGSGLLVPDPYLRCEQAARVERRHEKWRVLTAVTACQQSLPDVRQRYAVNSFEPLESRSGDNYLCAAHCLVIEHANERLYQEVLFAYDLFGQFGRKSMMDKPG
jgi:hypothetical protein